MEISGEATNLTIKRLWQLIDEYCDGRQTDFASRVGVSRQFVSQCLRGANTMSSKTAMKIGVAFGVNPLWVLGVSDDKGINGRHSHSHEEPGKVVPKLVATKDGVSIEINGEIISNEEELAVIRAYRGLDESQKVLVRRVLGI